MSDAPVQNHPQSPEPSAGQPARPPVEQKAPPIKTPVTLGTRLLRWLLLILVLFGLGFLTAIFTLYAPARSRVKQLEAELAMAKETQAALVQQVNGLTTQVSGLASEVATLKNASLQSAVSVVYSDILNAQLALLKNDPLLASLTLSNTGERLDKAADQLSAEQRAVALSLQEPLQKAVDSLAKKDYPAAQSELDLLGSKLLVLLKALTP